MDIAAIDIAIFFIVATSGVISMIRGFGYLVVGLCCGNEL
jgi:uncharacterized membrane protein required for colicin V production